MDDIKKFKGKHLISFLRSGDFAHTGEKEAITLVMQKFPRDNNQLILDASCGLGETADFIQKSGWGKVIGIDVDPASIEYAKAHYPNVVFHLCDIIDIAKLFTIALFDIVCLFNIYHSLSNPRQALHSLHKVTKQDSCIAIFDYLDLCKDQPNPLFRERDPDTQPFRPIKKDEIKNLLSITGWDVAEIVEISDKYANWYQKLYNKLVSNKEAVIQKFGHQAYEQYYETYHDIFDAIQQGLLGGVIIYATKKKS